MSKLSNNLVPCHFIATSILKTLDDERQGIIYDEYIGRFFNMTTILRRKNNVGVQLANVMHYLFMPAISCLD